MSKVAAERCRQVWCSVVLQAAVDILAVPTKIGSAVARPSQFEHGQAVGWLGSRDFRKVCELAGLEPGIVEQGLRRRLAEVESGLTTKRDLFISHGGRRARDG